MTDPRAMRNFHQVCETGSISGAARALNISQPSVSAATSQLEIRLSTRLATTLPLLLACAQFDPPRFQAEFLNLMTERLERHGAMPRSVTLSGHNHYTMAMHLGTADRRLADEIAGFVKDVT